MGKNSKIMDDKEFEDRIKQKLEGFEYSGAPSTGAMSDFMSRLGSTPVPASGWAVWKPYMVAAAMVTSVAFNVYFWNLYSSQSTEIDELRHSIALMAGVGSSEARVDTLYVYQYADDDSYSQQTHQVLTASNTGNLQTSIKEKLFINPPAGAERMGRPMWASNESLKQNVPGLASADDLNSSMLLSGIQPVTVFSGLTAADHELNLTRDDIRRMNRTTRLSVAEVVPVKKEAKGFPLSMGITSGILYPFRSNVDTEVSGIIGAVASWRFSPRLKVGAGAEKYTLAYSVSPPEPGQGRPFRKPRFDDVEGVPPGPEKIIAESDIVEFPLMVSYSLGDGQGKVNPFIGMGLSAKSVYNQQFTIVRNQQPDVLVRVLGSDFNVATFNVTAGVTGNIANKLNWEVAATLGEDLGEYGADRTQFNNLKLQAGLAYNFF